MAKVLEKYMFKSRSQKYPWEKWLDGRVWEFIQGKDFKGSTATFRQSATSIAKRRGGKMRTYADGKKVVIQFIPDDDAAGVPDDVASESRSDK